jgi:hypothetical protein
MNEQIKQIIDTLKEMSGEAHESEIYNRIGINFSSKAGFDNVIIKMSSDAIIERLDKTKIIKLRAGLAADEARFLDIRFTIDESIVLYNFLRRVNETNIDKLIEDQSEKRVLWNLEGDLEKQLVEPFQPDFEQIVKACRDRLRDA